MQCVVALRCKDKLKVKEQSSYDILFWDIYRRKKSLHSVRLSWHVWNDKIIDNPILPIELSSPEIQFLYVIHQDLHIKIQINPVKLGLNINACLWSFNYQLYLYVLIVQKVFVSFELVGVYIKSCYLMSICGICCLDVDYYEYLKFIIIYLVTSFI